MVVASAFPSLASAFALGPTVVMLFGFFNGFLAPVDSMPKAFRWVHTISYDGYILKGLAINEMYNSHWSCNPGETLIPELDACALTDGHSALKLYDMVRYACSRIRYRSTPLTLFSAMIIGCQRRVS